MTGNGWFPSGPSFFGGPPRDQARFPLRGGMLDRGSIVFTSRRQSLQLPAFLAILIG
jgi:hypothetical protein